MKKLFSSLIALSVLIPSLLFVGGCKNGPNPTQAATMVHAAFQIGTYEAVQQDPKLRTPLQLSAVAVTGMCSNGVFDVSALDLAVNNAFGASPQNAIYVQAALAIYDGYVQGVVADGLGTNAYIQPVECAIGSGIQDGLNMSLTEAAYPTQTAHILKSVKAAKAIKPAAPTTNVTK